MFRKKIVLLCLFLLFNLTLLGCSSYRYTIDGQFDVTDNSYSVYRDRVHVSHGWLLMEGYETADFNLNELVENNYQDVAINSKDEVVKDDSDSLYYKGGKSFLSLSQRPFTGIYLTIEEKDLSLDAEQSPSDDRYIIEEALIFEEGILQKSKEFINQDRTEETKYYSGLEEDIWMEIVNDNSGEEGISIKKDYYRNDNLRALIELEGNELTTYEEYYEDGSLKREVVPLEGELEASVSNARNSRDREVEIEQGKNIRYYEDGELSGEYKYISGELQEN